MTAVAQPPAPPAKHTPRALIAAAVLVLILLLVAPAALVLVLRDDGGSTTPLRIARLPTDVAVLGDTVWVASGRDDRVIALEGGRADRAEPHPTGSSPLRVAAGAGSVWTANAGDDSVTRLNPLIPGDPGRRITSGATPSTSPSATTAPG